jgi:hypothetical protein
MMCLPLSDDLLEKALQSDRFRSLSQLHLARPGWDIFKLPIVTYKLQCLFLDPCYLVPVE